MAKRGRNDLDPSDMGWLFAMFLMMFGVQPEDANVHITGSPLYPPTLPLTQSL